LIKSCDRLNCNTFDITTSCNIFPIDINRLSTIILSRCVGVKFYN